MRENEEYTVLDEPRFVEYDDIRVADLAYDYARAAMTSGFETRVALNRVRIGKKTSNRTVVEGINRVRGKQFYLELLDNEWHFAQWGRRLVTMGDLTELIKGSRDE